jgi:hypothetical protein
MSNTIEVLKPDNDPPVLLQRKPRQVRQGWADPQPEVTQELPDTKVNILSPGHSSNGGDVCTSLKVLNVSYYF